jgi:hypothetical protein
MYLESSKINVSNLQTIGEYLELVLPDQDLTSKAIVNLALEILRFSLEEKLVKAVLELPAPDMTGITNIATQMREYLEGMVVDGNPA